MHAAAFFEQLKFWAWESPSTFKAQRHRFETKPDCQAAMSSSQWAWWRGDWWEKKGDWWRKGRWEDWGDEWEEEESWDKEWKSHNNRSWHSETEEEMSTEDPRGVLPRRRPLDGRQGARGRPSREKRKEARKDVVPKAEENKIDQGPMKYGSNKWCKTTIDNLTTEVEGLKHSLAYHQQQAMAMQAQQWQQYCMAQAQAHTQTAAPAAHSSGRRHKKHRSSGSYSSSSYETTRRPATANSPAAKPAAKPQPESIPLQQVAAKDEESSISSSYETEESVKPPMAEQERLETQPNQVKAAEPPPGAPPEPPEPAVVKEEEAPPAEPAPPSEPAQPAEPAEEGAPPAEPAEEGAASAEKPAEPAQEGAKPAEPAQGDALPAAEP